MPPARGDQFVGFLGPPRTRLVVIELRRACGDVGHDLPCPADSVAAREQCSVTDEYVVDQAFVRFDEVGAERSVVAEIHTCRPKLYGGPGNLGEKANGDTLVAPQHQRQVVMLERSCGERIEDLIPW